MEREKLTQLVLAAQQGNNNAIGELFNAFQNTVYNIALRETKDPETAADVTQEAFIEVIQTIGKLQEPAAFVSWLKTIVYHQCTRYYRKKENKHETLVEEREDAPALFDTLEEENEEFLPDKAMENEDFRKTIRAFIDKLPDVQRSAIMMKYFDDLSVKEIAAVQGVSENTVLSRLYYGRNAIKAEVEAYEKKHDTKLHAIPFLPMLRFLFNDAPQQMPPVAAAATAQAVGAATGVQLVVTTAAGTTAGAVAGATAASTAVGAATGTAAGAVAGTTAATVGIPLAAKIAAGVVAAVVAVTAPIAIHHAIENGAFSSDDNRHSVGDREDEDDNNRVHQGGGDTPNGGDDIHDEGDDTPNGGDDIHNDDPVYDPDSETYIKRGESLTTLLPQDIVQETALDLLFAYAYSNCPARYYDEDSGRYVVPEDEMWDMADTFFREQMDVALTQEDFELLMFDGPYFFGEYSDGMFLLGHNPADVRLSSHLVIPEEKVILLFFSYKGDSYNWAKTYCMVGYQYDGEIDETQFSAETDRDGWYLRYDDPAFLDSLQLGYIGWTPYSTESIFNGGGLGMGGLFGDDDLLGDLLGGLL